MQPNEDAAQLRLLLGAFGREGATLPIDVLQLVRELMTEMDAHEMGQNGAGVATAMTPQSDPPMRGAAPAQVGAGGDDPAPAPPPPVQRLRVQPGSPAAHMIEVAQYITQLEIENERLRGELLVIRATSQRGVS